MGAGFAGAHDFRVQDVVKDPLLHQTSHVLALQLRLGKARQLLIHAVDAQARARSVTDENAVRQSVKYALHMF